MKPKQSKNMVISVAWYRPQEWTRLLEVSVDRADLERSHREWVTNAERQMKRLHREGFIVQKVDVPVDELVEWARQRGRLIDAAARVDFAMEKGKLKWEQRGKQE